MKKNALISVYNKAGIVEFAQQLVDMDWNIYASGGTAKVLQAAGIPVIDVASIVGGSAILGHKVVTLSRELMAGLLADPNSNEEMDEMKSLNLPIIDLVCVDCYPLEEAITKPGATRESIIAQTDIGGPTMLRAGAKGRRIVICQSSDRQAVIDWLQNGQPHADNFITNLVAVAEEYVGNYALLSGDYHRKSLLQQV